jgi:CRISPR-associated protein Cmr5
MGHRINIEQERAKAAFEFATRPNKKGSNYDGNAKKLPMYILNNGLLNTLAFVNSKKDWQQLYEDITIWFRDKDVQGLIKDKFVDNKSLIEVVLSLDDTEIRQVTNETLALLSWLRRFVKQEEN